MTIRASYILILLTCLLFGIMHSCTDPEPGNSNRTDYLPSSSGEHDEVLIVINEQDWQGILGDTIISYLMADYPRLPQSEPMYDLRQVDKSGFADLLKRSRNIILVGDFSSNDPTSLFIRETLGEEYVQKAQNDPVFRIVAKKDVWSAPQQVIFWFAPDRAQLLEAIASGYPKVIGLLEQMETTKYYNSAFAFGTNTDLTKKLREEHGIPLDIPEPYVLAQEVENFLWLRKEEDEVSTNIMIYYLDIDPNTFIFKNYGLEVRDTLGKNYISSKIDSAYMITANMFAPISNKVLINQMDAFENRGLWELENDFMGGPFINYCFYDRERSRLVVLDGFIYAPGKDKRKPMKSLGVILRQYGAE